jgi:sporulation protein YlmC with PRC-barrel domain
MCKMEIPLNAKVECTDGLCGRSVYVLINPVIGEVTHLVVKENSSHIEYVVPVEVVSETTADTIRLRCSLVDLKKMEPFIKTMFIEERMPDSNEGVYGAYGMGYYYYVPYITPEKIVQMPVKERQVPPGEFAVRRGTRVEATDGYVGHVDEFVVNPENGHITHLVMREGHIWGQKDVIIPLSAMNEAGEETVFLKLAKHQIESLPTFPVKRHWA